MRVLHWFPHWPNAHQTVNYLCYTAFGAHDSAQQRIDAQRKPPRAQGRKEEDRPS